MSMRYVTVWIFILILLFIFAIFPNILIVISNFFGFEATSSMIFLIGYFLLFYLVFNQSIEISKHKYMFQGGFFHGFVGNHQR